MRRTCLFGKFLAAVACMLSVVLNVQAQETVFVFEGTATGDFAAAHAATDFSAYEQTTLKVSGPLNGDDINAIKTAISQRFTTLDISGAKITSEGQYTGEYKVREMKEDTIATYMFARSTNLQHIVFPEGLKAIEAYAFAHLGSNLSNLQGLLSLELPASVRYVGPYAFEYNALTGGVVLNDGLEYLGSAAFCYSNLSSIVIPGSVKTADNALSGSNVSSITIGMKKVPGNLVGYGSSPSSAGRVASVVFTEGVEEIGDEFLYKSSTKYNPLKSVTFPSTLKKIGAKAFSHAGSLTNVTLPASLDSIGEEAFESVGISELELPANLKYIGAYAFRNTDLTSIEIPDAIESIGNYCFYNCTSLSTVKFPAGLKEIGSYAFYNNPLTELDLSSYTQLQTIGSNTFDRCRNLSTVKFPASLQSIGAYAFNYCDKIAPEFAEGSSLKSIGAYAFYSCSEMTSISIPESVEEIGQRAFASCRKLTTANIPTSLKEIPAGLFSSCSELTGITIPASVHSIGESAFYDCNIQELDLSSHTQLKTIGPSAFQSNNNLGTVKFPASLQSIGNDAFMYCYKIAPEFAEGSILKSIGVRAFYNCYEMTSISIPNNVEEIGSSAFQACSKLATANIPTSLKAIPEGMFADCSQLTDVTIPASVQSIGASAFAGCVQFTKIAIPEGVTALPSNVFKGCTSLSDITLPTTLTSIGSNVFQNCKFLESITLPSGLLSIGSGAFWGCIGLKSIVLPDNVTNIDVNTFRGCTALESITLPKNLATLPANFLEECTSLKYVKIPDGVTALPANMFNNCSALQDVDMPDGITSFGSQCFGACASLKDFDFPSSLNTIGSYAFDGCKTLTAVNIPAGVSNLAAGTFRDCTALQSVELPDSLVSIGNYCFDNCTSLAGIELPAGLATLGTHALSNCTSLTQVTIPADIKSISDYLFYGCTALESVGYAPDITSIGSYSFYDCQSLKQFAIPQTVTSIGSDAFRGCAKITSITIPEGIKAVPDHFCYGCTSLADVTLPSTITSIGTQSFYNCASLREIKLPEGLATIGSSAFAYAALDKVSMPSTVTTIKGNAFGNCDNLVTFTVNEGCTSIIGSPSAWNGCDNLTALYLPSTITKLFYYTFQHIPNIKEVHVKMAAPINPSDGNYNFGKSGCKLYVPVGSADAYKAHQYWKNNWAEIVEEEYGLASLPDAEFEILKQLPTLTGGENWRNKWVFAENKADCEMPYGVTVSKGHIFSIMLGSNNLQGELPYVVFSLPYLNTLDISNNSLIGELAAYGKDQRPVATVCDSLRTLNISGNQFTGDLACVMAYAPNLTSLNASYNKISDISNPLPVSTLEFYGQDLRDIYTVNYSDIFNLKGDPQSAVPTVFTYSNKSNSTASANIDTYNNYFYLVISDAWNVNSQGYWYGSMTKRLDNANSSMGYYSYDSWCDGWYTKPLGETLNAGVKTSTSRWNDYHRFNVVMDCQPGDVNFDAQLNITDMQRTLNYALDSTYYNRYTPFNFTAANLIATDRTINVQDVVANINLLLDSGVTPKLAKGNRSKDTAQDEEPEAVLYVKDGRLMLNTTRPVAALDLLLTGENVKWSPAVDAFSKKSKGNRTIVYSLFGDEIMEGETVIAELDGDIDDAMIVDIDGNEIRLNVIKGNYDGTTAIEGAQAADDSNAAVFDLQGRKVAERFDRNTLKPGIYIVNGKKVVIK